jgi:hypothetical protein
LFIGNSFTARNNLPGLVADLAAAAGKRMEHHLISAGGASLRRHWNGVEARRTIAGDHYDYVVLQEQGTLLIKNPQRMLENVRRFDTAIRAAGARPALYMTWARRHAPQTQAAITDAYTSIARATGATLIPVGVAWEACLRTPNHPNLFDRDGSHPTLAGSFLAACVAFAALFQASPRVRGLRIEGMTVADVKLLQKVAAKVIDR